MKDEVITDIIKSFGIGNTFYIEKIINISRGNARIAVMCVILVKHKQSLDSLDNIPNYTRFILVTHTIKLKKQIQKMR